MSYQGQGSFQPPRPAYSGLVQSGRGGAPRPPAGYQQFGQPGVTAGGMPQNKAAGISYLFRWISGLVFIIKEPYNPFVRFHAMQSLMFFGGLNLIMIVLLATIFLSIPVVSFIAIILWILLETVRFFAWIVMTVKGFRGKYFRLPFIGRLAEKYSEEFKIEIR